jgi:hypothetical protein
MAALAHDASGPASSESAGFAVQQARTGLQLAHRRAQRSIGEPFQFARE